jgi:hypothetical protein
MKPHEPKKQGQNKGQKEGRKRRVIKKQTEKREKAIKLLGTELSLSSRGRMTLGVGEIFWFISHTLP